jgi:antitoxin FitA
MKKLEINRLSTKAFNALLLRAQENERSPQAEAAAILEQILAPEGRLQMGTALSDMSRKSGLTNHDVDALEGLRAVDSSLPTLFG